jgi:hypothetical protein
MNVIENIFEPSRLLLVWHHTNSDAPRQRRVVGELIRSGEDAAFRYLKDTEDFKAALNEGFFEFPAFADKDGNDYQYGALDVFMRRLPPRKREDFKEYLAQYSLPTSFTGSNFALLAYTGARLASDTFELCPDLTDAKAPVDFVIEVSGVQHYVSDEIVLCENDDVFFVPELDNQFDSNAVKVMYNDNTIGYVNKALSKSFSHLMRSGVVRGKILKSSFQKKRPRLVVLVKFL